MAEYDRAIATAKRQIKQKGRIVVWRSLADATPVDPNTPWKVSGAAGVNHDVSIVFLPTNRQNLETFGYKPGMEIPKGAEFALMAQVPFEPNMKDIVVRDGRELRIDNMIVLAPNGQKILYKILFKL